MTTEQLAVAAVVVAAGSEIIALSPLKSNSWVQLVFQGLRIMFPKRR